MVVSTRHSKSLSIVEEKSSNDLSRSSIKFLSVFQVVGKTREDLEREALTLLTTFDLNDTSNIPLPFLFDIAIRLYNLVKTSPEFFVHSRLNELVELTFQRYRAILKVRSSRFFDRISFLSL